jgi:hypothetical protein
VTDTAALALFAAGWLAGWTWCRRDAVLDALMAAVDWLSRDPEPPPPLRARPCVRLVRDEDGAA